MIKEVFRTGKIDLGDRFGSVTEDGVVYREPFRTRPIRRSKAIGRILKRDTKLLSAEEIIDQFFKP